MLSTGRVRDMEPFLNAARVFVSPIIVGTGLNVKNLVALEYGLPLVTTVIGAEGLRLVDGQSGAAKAMIATDPQTMADAIVMLHQNKARHGCRNGSATHPVRVNRHTPCGISRSESQCLTSPATLLRVPICLQTLWEEYHRLALGHARTEFTIQKARARKPGREGPGAIAWTASQRAISEPRTLWRLSVPEVHWRPLLPPAQVADDLMKLESQLAREGPATRGAKCAAQQPPRVRSHHRPPSLLLPHATLVSI